MSIFGGLGQDNLADTAIDPKRLFRALSKPVGSPFQFPYDIQTEVWDKWFARRHEPDLVIKMNTGSGKTVIGLVILKASLNENKGPAVYLVPDRQLQAQVEQTASSLGIEWTDDPYDARFRQSRAVLIVTVHAMYNGLSKFGVRGSQGRPIEVGTIIVDDAHACIPIIENQFGLTIARGEPAYDELLHLFAEALKTQSLAGYSGLDAGEGSQAVPIPYWDWHAQHEAAFRAINRFAAVDDNEKFRWPLIRENLRLCDVAITPQQIEVRLPYPDLSVLPSYVNASRRIYMTATLADDSILTTHMGVAPECVVAPIVPASASDLGDRLILTPMETSRVITFDQMKQQAALWAREHNVVVIVPSRLKADEWRTVTSEIHNRESIDGVVARLRAGYVGLVVLIARYDGVDLPNGACRILILDGLPERYSPLELVEAAAIGETDAMSVRQVQRIEQGMGRGVRSADDYCAVILLNPRLVEKLYRAAAKQQLSPGTRAQYELGSTFSERGHGQTMQFFDSAIRAFLDRSSDWVNASKQALEGVTYEVLEEVPATAVAERNAFELALAGRLDEAASAFQPVFDVAADYPFRGWLKQRAASYLDIVDPVRARGLQRSARIDNNFVLKIPMETSSERISALGDQAAASSRYMVETYATQRLFEVEVDALLTDLTPSTEPNSYLRFEAAFQKLGSVLGFNSTRPDQEAGNGPDNLWAIGSGLFWTVEAKSMAVATEISREYLEQLSHSADWFDALYGDRSQSQLPVIIHPSRVPMWNAVPRQGARVMTFDRLAELRVAFRSFATAVTLGQQYRDVNVVRENLRQFGLNSSALEQRWTETFLPPSTRR